MTSAKLEELATEVLLNSERILPSVRKYSELHKTDGPNGVILLALETIIVNQCKLMASILITRGANPSV